MANNTSNSVESSGDDGNSLGCSVFKVVYCYLWYLRDSLARYIFSSHCSRLYWKCCSIVVLFLCCFEKSDAKLTPLLWLFDLYAWRPEGFFNLLNLIVFLSCLKVNISGLISTCINWALLICRSRSFISEKFSSIMVLNVSLILLFCFYFFKALINTYYFFFFFHFSHFFSNPFYFYLYPIFILLVIFCLSWMLLIKCPFESILPWATCNLVFICETIWSFFFYFLCEFNQLSFCFFLWFCLFLFLIFVFLIQDKLSYPQILIWLYSINLECCLTIF